MSNCCCDIEQKFRNVSEISLKIAAQVVNSKVLIRTDPLTLLSLGTPSIFPEHREIHEI